MQKKIIVEYDYVRAITTILVILGHCTYYSIKTNYGGIDLGIEVSCFAGKALTVLTTAIYSFHMPLFIALSGCLWAIKNKQTLSFKDLLSSKSRRLLKPFLFTALFLSIPLKFISGYWGGFSKETLSDIILGQLLFVGNANSHLWFLQTLFLIFVVAYFIEKFNLRQCKTLFVIVLFIISIAGRYMISQGLNFLNLPYAIMMYLIWFYSGTYFEMHREQINSFTKRRLNKWSVMAVFIILQVVLSYINSKQPHPITYFTYYVLAISGMLLTYVICYRLSLSRYKSIDKNIRAISKYSYDLYLFSDPYNYIFIFILGLIPNYGMIFTDNALTLAIYLLRFLFTTFGALLIIKCFKELPEHLRSSRIQ